LPGAEPPGPPLPLPIFAPLPKLRDKRTAAASGDASLRALVLLHDVCPSSSQPLSVRGHPPLLEALRARPAGQNVRFARAPRAADGLDAQHDGAVSRFKERDLKPPTLRLAGLIEEPADQADALAAHLASGSKRSVNSGASRVSSPQTARSPASR
jgi:hypothetical protein